MSEPKKMLATLPFSRLTVKRLTGIPGGDE